VPSKIKNLLTKLPFWELIDFFYQMLLIENYSKNEILVPFWIFQFILPARHNIALK